MFHFVLPREDTSLGHSNPPKQLDIVNTSPLPRRFAETQEDVESGTAEFQAIG